VKTILRLVFSILLTQNGVALSQHCKFLKNQEFVSDNSYNIEIGMKGNSVFVGSRISDTIISPFNGKVISTVSNLGIGGVSIKTDSGEVIYLTNLNKIFVSEGQTIVQGTLLGTTLFDDFFNKYILDISIAKGGTRAGRSFIS